MAGPKPQGGGLTRAGVGAKLGGELVGHGGTGGQDGSAVEQSGREIPAKEEESGFYGFCCRTTKKTTAATARKTSWGRFDSEGFYMSVSSGHMMHHYHMEKTFSGGI